MVRAIVGLNWGDEGKGRMVDVYAGKADVVIRFQGGSNAGHTVINDRGKFAFHNFPSGICHPGVDNIIAAGSVLNPDSFFKERDELIRAGLSCERIMISDRTTIITPYHLLVERLEEERLGDKKFGSTLSGIAPSYADRYAKKALLAGELLYPDHLRERLTQGMEYQNRILQGCYNADPLDLEEELERLVEWGKALKPWIGDTSVLLDAAYEKDASIILEAQLGALRDIGHGIYPFTTSSSVLAGNAAASVPIAPKRITTVTGITKAYSTCVGAGPFVTEIFDDLAHTIRETGKEYGATTGRPRRIGYFDAVATRFGAKAQGADEMVMTCVDVLSGIEQLKICIGYEIDGKQTDRFPIYPELVKATPVYEDIDGWSEDIQSVRRFSDLPATTQTYVRRVEELVGVNVSFLSVGPEREALIEM